MRHAQAVKQRISPRFMRFPVWYGACHATGVRVAQLFSIPLFLLVLGGCVASHRSHANGLGPLQSRCEAARARLGANPCERLGVIVLNNPAPGAYAYPSGKLCVTSGLLEMASEDELAAALAHELGHLYDRGHLEPPFALSGEGVEQHDMESRADSVAIKLLIRRNIAPGSLVSLLEKVAHHPATRASARATLIERLSTLRASTRREP